MLRDDIRSAVRALRAKPGFASLIIACLAIGIGANIAMFSIANVLFLQPPPGVRNAGSLLRLSVVRRTGVVQTPEGGQFSYPDFFDVRRSQKEFNGLAASAPTAVTVGHGAEAEPALGEYATADYFRVLGTRTAQGRFFTADEDSVRGLHPAVVLGYDFWQSHFQGRDVIGHTLTIDDRPIPIVGVAERGFQGVGYRRIDLWLPSIEIEAGTIHLDPLSTRWRTALYVIGRLTPGVSLPRAMSAATAALTAGVSGDPKVDQHPQVVARQLSDMSGWYGPPQGTLVLWLFGAVGFVLLIACANVANLLLARAVQRRRELAVRLSLGIGRHRLARQMLYESVILALSGTAVGLLIAWWGTAIWSIPELGRHPSPWDPTVLAFALGLALVTSIVFGVAPALSATKTDLSLLLKDGAPSASRTHAGRNTLIALQAALSLIVLAGGGLFVRSLQKMTTVDLGIDADHVVFLTPRMPDDLRDSARNEAIRTRVVARLATLPGVRAVSVEDIRRFTGIMAFDVWRPGPDSMPAEANTNFPIVNLVGPSYAEALGTPLLMGRDITAADRLGTLPVTVVSQHMARVFWPGRNPLGQCLMVSIDQYPPAHCWYVVGVVGDARLGLGQGPDGPGLFYYLPRAQATLSFGPTIIVRTTGPARAAMEGIRAAVLQAAPEVMYAEAKTVPMLLAEHFAPVQLGALLFTIFGIAALGLTAIGLYGVVAYLVAQRTREVGIRMALGSTALAAIALMAREGAKPVAIGLVVGLAGAVGVTRFLQHFLYNVSPTDGLSFAAAAGLLGLVAAVACIVPARKAAKVDPVVALRSE